MKINRVKLIALIDAEITRLNDQADELFSRNTAEAERRRDVYVRTTSAAWQEFAQRINVAVADGKPVTVDLLPQSLGGGGQSHVFGRSSVKYLEVWQPEIVKRQEPNTTALRKLRDVLLLSDDDEVSTYGLEKQGFPLGRTLGIGS